MKSWGAGVLCGMLAWAGSEAAQAQAAASEPFEVALHARTTFGDWRNERAAWISLELPLERLAAGGAAPEASPQVPDPLPAAPAEPSGVPTPPSYEQLQTLSSFTRRATRVALAVAGTAAERRRLDGLASRSRLSALLPELRLLVRRNTDQALRWAPTTDDPYRITQADGAGTTLEASASFRLERLLYSRDELNVEKLREQAGKRRLELERRVLAALLGLYRAHALGCAADADEAARTAQLTRSLELAVELDALTAGWFSEQAAALGRALWGFPGATLGRCVPEAEQAQPPAPVQPSIPVASSENSE